MDAGSVSQLLSLGPVGVILVALGAATWRVLTFLAGRLFNEDPNKGPKGLIVRAVDEHFAAMRALSTEIRNEVKELRESIDRLADAQRQLAERHCHAPRGHVGAPDE